MGDSLRQDNPAEFLRGRERAGDPMGAAVGVALADLEKRAHGDGWDKPAELFVLYRELIPDGVMQEFGLGEAALGMVVRCEHIVTFPRTADGGEIAFRLDHVAKALAKADAPRAVDGEILGWVLLNEAWMARLPNNATKAEREQLERDGAAHRVHARSDRVEIRIVVCADSAGVLYFLQRQRDTDEVSMTSWDAHDANGRIADALRALMEASR